MWTQLPRQLYNWWRGGNSDVTENIVPFATCLCEEVAVVVTVEACDEEREYVGTAVTEQLPQFLPPCLPQTQTSIVGLLVREKEKERARVADTNGTEESISEVSGG